MILVFWMLSFKPNYFLSSFTFIKRLFSSSSLSAIRVVSSAYLRLLIFLPAILIPACASFSPAFRMMYSAYKLNKQGDNIQPWCIPFPIGNQSVVPCLVLAVASWPAYRFLRRQVRWSDIPMSWRLFHSLLCMRHNKSMRRQKDMTLKDELPRLVGGQYATGEEWRNNSRKNEERNQSENSSQLWMWLVMKVNSNAGKNNIA